MQAFVAKTAQTSAGRLFIGPMQPAEGVLAPGPISVRGTILSKTTSGSRDVHFEVVDPAGHLLHSTDVTLEIEPGVVPFGFDWPAVNAAEGDYTLRVTVVDTRLGEDARAEWRVALRDPAAVAARVETARAQIKDARASAQGNAAALQSLTLAEQSLAPGAEADRPLIEADLNARVASHVAGRVRATLALRKAPTTGSELPVESRMRGAFVLPSGADSGTRAAELGFDFVPWMVTSGGGAPGGDLPVIAWLPPQEGAATVPSADLVDLAKSAPTLTALSLWASPSAPNHDGETVAQFREYVRKNYRDHMELNRAWKRHLLSFDEVEFWPDADARAYRADVQAFERQRGSRWFADQLRQFEPVLAPAIPVMTFTDAVLVPGDLPSGLDTEGLAATMDKVPVRIGGPLEDARYAQRYPEAAMTYALFHSFAPAKRLVALHAVDLALADRLRVDAAAHMRTLAVEAALAGVSDLAVQLTAFDDPVIGAPEAITGFLDGLRDLRAAQPVVDAFVRDVPPIAILWSDSSRMVDGGAPHLGALANAYAGCSFTGLNVGIITEQQLAHGQWQGVRAVVLPDVAALNEEAAAGIDSLIASGASLIRTETMPIFDERGRALGRTLSFGEHSVLVQGNGEPKEYLSAVDALLVKNLLGDVPRAVTQHGYMVEGVKTRYVKTADGDYLYVLNLRPEPVLLNLNRKVKRATDVLTGREVLVPGTIKPLDPMILRLEMEPETAPAPAATGIIQQ